MTAPLTPARLDELTRTLPAAVPPGCTHALVTTISATGVEVVARFAWHEDRWVLAPVVDYTFDGHLTGGVTLTVAW